MIYFSDDNNECVIHEIETIMIMEDSEAILPVFVCIYV